MSQPRHTICADDHPVVAAVRRFVAREVRPHASALEHADRYPHDMVTAMKDLGLFGALVPERWGGLGLDVTTYARVIEEMCRGWMSLAGVINSHTMAALIVLHHGTDEQRTMNQHPLHSDAHYAATHTQHGQRVVLGPLGFSVVIGMTVADLSGRAIANLEVNALRHERPTFIGDTLDARSRVLDTRESRQGDRGVVTVETIGANQRGETVCSYVRKVLVPRRNHPSLGEGRLPY